MTLKEAAERLLRGTKKTRFEDLVEVPADCVEALRKALEAEKRERGEERCLKGKSCQA
jgi:hypothetical protein